MYFQWNYFYLYSVFIEPLHRKKQSHILFSCLFLNYIKYVIETCSGFNFFIFFI